MHPSVRTNLLGHTSGSTNQRPVNEVILFFSWIRQGPSGMFVIEMAQLTAYQVIDMQELVMMYKDKGLKRVETEGKNLVLYLDEVRLTNIILPNSPDYYVHSSHGSTQAVEYSPSWFKHSLFPKKMD